MPVYPLEFEEPRATGHYPHMAKHDGVIWERFLELRGDEFDGVAYDVALGGAFPVGEDIDQATLLGFRYSTALKVDVVAQRGDELWIIELRPNAGVSAVGAVLCYTVLATLEGLSPLRYIPTVLTDAENPDIARCCEELFIQYIAIGRVP